MAPDLDSTPTSPRPPSTVQTPAQARPPPVQRQPSLPASRRTSQIMGPPPLPLSSPSGAVSSNSNASASASASAHQILFPPLSPSASAAGMPELLGPVRHPRPLTPAELHMELEKEGEAMVNRLTRELSALRAHSSSVASNASISSSSTTAAANPQATTQEQWGRRTRSSSSASAGIGGPGQRSSISGAAGLETQASTPSAVARNPSVSSMSHALPGGAAAAAVGGPLMQTTSRYEEVMAQRQELEEAKRENERLRGRVKELEALVRERKGGAAVNGGTTHANGTSVAPGTGWDDRAVGASNVASNGGEAAERGGQRSSEGDGDGVGAG